MAMREFLLIKGGRDADASVRTLPLSYDVLSGFMVLHAIPSAEAVLHPLSPARMVCRMPDGRSVLVEMTGSAGSVHGEPVDLFEAAEIAERVLQSDGGGSPLDAHVLAVALLGLLAVTKPAPVAREGEPS